MAEFQPQQGVHIETDPTKTDKAGSGDDASIIDGMVAQLRVSTIASDMFMFSLVPGVGHAACCPGCVATAQLHTSVAGLAGSLSTHHESVKRCRRALCPSCVGVTL